MSAAEPIIDALTEAAPRLSNPEVRAAYEQLVRMLEMHVLGQPFMQEGVEPLTETQLVFLRHGLRGLSHRGAGQTAWAEMQEAAESLQTVVRNQTVIIGQQVKQHIKTVNGGNVTMTGIVNTYGAPPAPATVAEDDEEDDSTLPSVPGLLPELEPDPTPRPRHRHDIFLSYSRKDARTMRRLHADLTAAGFTIWTDEDLTPGTPSWMTAIETAIQTAGCMVVLLTPDSKKSRWVEREITRASIYEVPIFPLLARGDERSAVPLLLSSHQYSDIRKEREYRMSVRKLIRSIRAELYRLKEV